MGSCLQHLVLWVTRYPVTRDGALMLAQALQSQPGLNRFFNALISAIDNAYILSGLRLLLAGRLADLHSFDPAAQPVAWAPLSTATDQNRPAARISHGFATAGGRLYVHGGWLESGEAGSECNVLAPVCFSTIELVLDPSLNLVQSRTSRGSLCYFSECAQPPRLSHAQPL